MAGSGQLTPAAVVDPVPPPRESALMINSSKGAMRVPASMLVPDNEGSSTTDELEESRLLASAAKRKLQRVRGAVAALEGLTAADHASNLVSAEGCVTDAHAKLAYLYEVSDGCDSYKRARAEWHEAGGVTAFVKAQAELRGYLPAVEREEIEAREAWEAVQPAKRQLAQHKEQLARVQGHFYALLELGFTLPPQLDHAVGQQRAMWEQEEVKAATLVDVQAARLAERRVRRELEHRAQGYRKAGERFGEVLGIDALGLARCRLEILEHEATQLRLGSKATLKVLQSSKAAHEHTVAELHGATGAIAFLTQLKEQVC